MKHALLVAALFFATSARCDTIFTFGGQQLFTLPSPATPDLGSVAANDFTFSQVLISTNFGEHTFDLHFFTLNPTGAGAVPNADLMIACDPWGVFFTPDLINKSCDEAWMTQIDGPPFWTDVNGAALFTPGSYNDGTFVITETSEASTLALLLASAALYALIRRQP